MALTYGFYNSSGGDRKYNSEQISAVFNFLITEGVLSSYGDHFAVVPGQGRQVIVQSGWAWFDSTWTQNDSDLPLAIEPPDISVSRIDAVVIETNKNLDKRRNTIKIVQGTPSSNPQKPPLVETTAMNEHAIAYVTVQPSATSIALTDIEIVVGKDECPFCTSILQSTSISVLFNQWEGEFDAWFEHIQTVLSEEVVTNLYAEIDKCVKKADKATEAEAKAGTNDTHWMTPAKVKSAVESRVKNGYILIQAPNLMETLYKNSGNGSLSSFQNFLISNSSATYQTNTVSISIFDEDNNEVYFSPTQSGYLSYYIDRILVDRYNIIGLCTTNNFSNPTFINFVTGKTLLSYSGSINSILYAYSGDRHILITAKTNAASSFSISYKFLTITKSSFTIDSSQHTVSISAGGNNLIISNINPPNSTSFIVSRLNIQSGTITSRNIYLIDSSTGTYQSVSAPTDHALFFYSSGYWWSAKYILSSSGKGGLELARYNASLSSYTIYSTSYSISGTNNPGSVSMYGNNVIYTIGDFKALIRSNITWLDSDVNPYTLKKIINFIASVYSHPYSYGNTTTILFRAGTYNSSSTELYYTACLSVRPIKD